MQQNAMVPLRPEAQRLEQPDGSRPTVLLVDDDDHLRSLLRKIFSRAGYWVLDAPFNSAAFFLAVKHEGPIDVIVMDVMMPGMLGPEVIDRVRRWRPDVRVLYISGQRREYLERRRVLAPTADFMQKPFDPHLLLKRVEEITSAST